MGVNSVTLVERYGTDRWQARVWGPGGEHEAQYGLETEDEARAWADRRAAALEKAARSASVPAGTSGGAA